MSGIHQHIRRKSLAIPWIDREVEVWAQATASAAVGAVDGRPIRIGCLFQYVSDRQHHSMGPKR
jgi:hypothetical protein